MRAVVLATAALLAAVPGATAAPTVTLGARCSVYWPGQGSQPIAVNVSGLAAGQSVQLELKVKGQTVSGVPSITADGAGNVSTTLTNWTSGLGTGPTRSAGASVVAKDAALGTVLAEEPFKVANVGVKVDSSARSAGSRRRWVVSGLTPLGGGSIYYAFYFKGSKQVGRQRLGRVGDACGYLSTRKVLIPFKRFGTFKVRIQASHRWRGDALPWIGGSVSSYRVYR